MVELARAESAGAQVFGLVWQSHLDRFRFSEEQNRTPAQALQAMNAQVVLDMRVRRGESHHQKFVVIGRRDDPSRDVAFVGGTDLGHSRNDDHEHRGDPQSQPMPHRYGPNAPWHDAMVEIAARRWRTWSAAFGSGGRIRPRRGTLVRGCGR